MIFETINFSLNNHVAIITLNRPDKANALNETMFNELIAIFQKVNEDGQIFSVILNANGPHFCSGIDLDFFQSIQKEIGALPGNEQQDALLTKIQYLQSLPDLIEACPVPVLAAVQGGCIGGGLDIIAACDMRYGTVDSAYSIKEIDLGLVADLGSLHRLPGVVGTGKFRELAYTGRDMAGLEAHKVGLVNEIYQDVEALMDGVMTIANLIASKQPLIMRSIKQTLLHEREHSIKDGLDYVARLNCKLLCR